MSRESRRLALQEKLEEILGSRHVYFQPPASISMQYPCFVYSFKDYYTLYSDNVKYLTQDRYSITLITKEAFPEQTIEAIEAMPYTKFDRYYVADNLHHFSYTIESFERYDYD